MKDFEKIVQDVLNFREETKIGQKKLAEEIVEKTIKSFSDFSVKYITLSLSKNQKRIIINLYGNDSKKVNTFFYGGLCDGIRVLDNVKYILQNNEAIENTFKIVFQNNSYYDIKVKLLYDLKNNLNAERRRNSAFFAFI